MNPLALIGGIVGGLFDEWKAGREDKRKIASAIAENKVRLALDAQTHNEAWEMAALQGADVWLRRVSFALWSFPMVWAGINPQAAEYYFKSVLTCLPEWYVNGFLAITGAVWGLSELKASGIFSGRGSK